MLSTLIGFLVALVASAVLTPVVRGVATSVGIVDSPTARRVHTRAVPRLGGIAIVSAVLLSILALFALDTQLGRTFFGSPRTVVALVVGALMVSALGLVDDLVGVGAKRKLLVQTLAAAAAYAGGLRIGVISLPFGGTIALGWLSLPATVLWITAVINALNLIDGLDGLAAGVTFFACVTNFVVAYLSHNVLICLLSATLAGSIIGFLIYNFNPATIFMGDSGSMFLGYMLATTSLMGAASQKSPTVIAILVPLIALGLPIVDMLFAMVRRFLERRPIFAPDRGHIHHRLLDLGLTHRRAVLMLYGASLAFTAVALVIHFGRSWQIGLALTLLTVTLIGVVRFLGYFNVVFERQRRARGADPVVEGLRRTVPSIIPALEAAPGTVELNAALESVAKQGGLLAVEIATKGATRVGDWRWEARESTDQQRREAVSVTFSLRDATDGPTTAEVVFFWDSETGVPDPRAEILLQLVADAIESFLRRPSRARVASRAGRLRPV